EANFSRSFPHRRPELMWKWLLAMGRANMKPKTHHKICSKHFEKSCFFAGLDRPCLRPSAIPTLFSCAQPKTKTLARKPLQRSRTRPLTYRREEPIVISATDGTLESSSATGCQSVLKNRVAAGRKSASSGETLPKSRAPSEGRKAQRQMIANRSLPANMKLPAHSETVNRRKMANKSTKNSTELLPNTTESTMVARKITVKCQLAADGKSALCKNSIGHAAKRLPLRTATNEGTATDNSNSDHSVLHDRSSRSLLRKRQTEVSDCVPLKKRPFQDGNIVSQDPLKRYPTVPCSSLSSPNPVPLPGALGEDNSTVNRQLDTGSSQSTTTAAEALFLHTYCGDERTSPDLPKVVGALQDTRQRLYTANRKLKQKEQTLRQQRTAIDELQEQVSRLKHASEGCRVSDRLPTDLIRDWHENASRVPHARRYRLMTLEFAAGLYACSADAYKFLSRWLPMPSIQSARKHVVGTVAPGVPATSLDSPESFEDGCEALASETEQALAALGASLSSVGDIELEKQDGVLLSPQET
ncbi:unnamed protein product, partial [Ixodes hexagonus]